MKFFFSEWNDPDHHQSFSPVNQLHKDVQLFTDRRTATSKPYRSLGQYNSCRRRNFWKFFSLHQGILTSWCIEGQQGFMRRIGYHSLDNRPIFFQAPPWGCPCLQTPSRINHQNIDVFGNRAFPFHRRRRWDLIFSGTCYNWNICDVPILPVEPLLLRRKVSAATSLPLAFLFVAVG